MSSGHGVSCYTGSTRHTDTRSTDSRTSELKEKVSYPYSN